jgi:CMP-N-acetylneuraminic acid synthetase
MIHLIALVPMRHHSQRVPGKNYRPLASKPLFHHIIQTLLDCPQISKVVVDTDSPPIIEGLGEHFSQVQIIERPERLRADDVSMNEVLLHDTEMVEADFYLQTHSTNPLLCPETVSRAIQAMLSNTPAYDSLFSVTRRQVRLWNQAGRPINHNPDILLQTQDLPPFFEENSCLYIFTRPTLLSRSNRLGSRPLMFEINAAEAWDIDDELDFSIAEFLMERQSSIKIPQSKI